MTSRRVKFFLILTVIGAATGTAGAAAVSRTQLQDYAQWNARVDAVMQTASRLAGRTERLDALSREIASGSVSDEDARLRGAAIISDLRTRLAKIRARARNLPPPPVTAHQPRNKAAQVKRQYTDQLTEKVAGIVESSVAIYESAISGEKTVEKKLYMKFSQQMIVLLEAENQTNLAAIASQPADPLHPQYHLLSCVVETNEAMMAIWNAIIDVSRGQDASRIHARMTRRIGRAGSRVKTLTRKGREQVKTYRKLFREGRQRGEYPKVQVDLLNRMMDTYEPAYDVEEKIADALLAYSELPNMAEQTDAHRRKAEEILGAIGPLAERREKLQARRTQMAANL
ncbi:MAG: hypothetical protein ACLFWF_05135 [Alphaproteobacteria bacterium]